MTDESATLEDELDAVLRWLSDVTVLSDEVESAARLLLLDTVGCAIAGGAKPEVATVGAELARLEPGPLTIPGLSPGLSVSGAAYLMALSACWDEACEGLARAHGRPGLHTIPAVVALGLAPTTGSGPSSPPTYGQILRAIVAGYEVAGRVGEVLRIRPGMHVDGTWGGVGGAVGAGVMLGATPPMLAQMIEAMACQMPWSQYLPVGEGATTRNLYVAEASARAVRTALATASGVTAPRGALSGYATGALLLDEIRRLAPPGEWLIVQGYLKPYAAVRHVHYGVSCALDWRRQDRGIEAIEAIEAIRLEIYPEAITYCGNRAPQTAIQAQFSLTYGVAHALVHGGLDPRAYTSEALADPEVRRLETLITVVPLPDNGTRQARLSIDHERHQDTIACDSVLGDPDRPMEIDHVVEKFTRYSQEIMGPAAGDRLVDVIVNGSLDQPLDL